MYPSPFRYHRPSSLREASALLNELGDEARLLAGGQSLIPLMKLRLAAPTDLVDLGGLPGLARIDGQAGRLGIGALTRHAEIAAAPQAREIPILGDCASGIADQQVRNMGTLGGSLAEADPSGDWAPVLLTLECSVTAVSTSGERTIELSDLIVDAYTTCLAQHEVLREVVIKIPPEGSGGAYLAFKRCAQVYATASAAVQLTLDEGVCTRAAICLGSVNLQPRRASAAERELVGSEVGSDAIKRAAEAARETAEPQPDMRGSVEYKRALAGTLVERAIQLALRRCRGEKVEGGHIYA